jgi:hypothetical protein
MSEKGKNFISSLFIMVILVWLIAIGMLYSEGKIIFAAAIFGIGMIVALISTLADKNK